MYTFDQYSVLESFSPWNVHTFGEDPVLDETIAFLISEKLLHPSPELDDNRISISERGKAVLHSHKSDLAISKKQADVQMEQASANIRDKKRDYIFQILLVLAAWALSSVSCNAGLFSSFFSH